VIALATSLAAQQREPARTDVPQLIDRDYYATGNRVDIEAPVNGDVVIAGRVLNVGGPVRGDILAAGWRITIADHVMDDVRMAGAELSIDAPVDGDLILAGGDVTLGRETHVSGRGWITGGIVRVNGQIDRELRIAGGDVQLRGELREPVHVVAERLHVAADARILGPITYEGPHPLDLSPGAIVTGPITYRQIGAGEARRARWPKGASSVLFTAHLFLAGLMLLLAVPRLTTSASDTLRVRPGQSLLVGLVLLVTLPFVAVLLVISVLGLPAGLAIGALYLVALFLGLLTTAFFVGHAEARLVDEAPTTKGRRTLALLAGVLTLAVLRSFPFVGTWVVFLSVVFGLGALALWLYRAYSTGLAEPLASGT
jgi:hypothetical protein